MDSEHSQVLNIEHRYKKNIDFQTFIIINFSSLALHLQWQTLKKNIKWFFTLGNRF